MAKKPVSAKKEAKKEGEKPVYEAKEKKAVKTINKSKGKK